MLVKAVNKDDYKPRTSDRKQKAYDLLMKMYNSEHNAFTIEDVESDYSSMESLRVYLKDAGMKITRNLLLENGFTTKEWHELKYNYGYMLNIFKIRKITAQRVILVTINSLNEETLTKYRKNCRGENDEKTV